MTARPRGRMLDDLMPENETPFQHRLEQTLPLLGWRHMFVRKSRVRADRHATATNVPGWPDLYIWSPAQHRTAHVELKMNRAYPSPDQRAVLTDLAATGVEVYLWKPKHWDEILTILKGPRPTNHPTSYPPPPKPKKER